MRLILKAEKDLIFKNSKHPWIFRGAIASCEGEMPPDAICEVADSSGTRLGYGFFSSESKIACRMFEFTTEKLDPDWIGHKLSSALALRKILPISSNAFRLINAEGDYFPGLIIDIYNKTCVVRPLIRATELKLDLIAENLLKLFPKKSVIVKRDETASRKEKLNCKTAYLVGSGDGKEIIEENGLCFQVDIFEGQKTGFYLDQRDNRELFSNFVADKKVLNLCSYTGAFSIYALKGNAKKVDALDTSARALAYGEKNCELNAKLTSAPLRWLKGDAFAFLLDSEIYNAIVLDPPPFARTKFELSQALKGYKNLNYLALKKLSASGVLFTFSCSGAVDTELFKKIIFEASNEAGRQIQIIQELHAACDHPYTINHLEGEYLKGFIIYAK